MTGLIQATATGEQHGLINVLANSVKDDGFKHMKPEVKAKAEKLKKEDSKTVTVRYLNRMGKHERLTKPYCKYAGDPIQIWKFIPNYTYTIPMGLVNEVNSQVIMAREGKCDENGDNPSNRDTQEEPEHQFVPVSFT